MEKSVFNVDNELISRCADEGAIGGIEEKKDESERCRAKGFVVEQQGYQEGCR